MMSGIEIIPPGRMSGEDQEALDRAFDLLEGDTLASRFTRAMGGQMGIVRRLVPQAARRFVSAAAEVALKTALRISLRTLRAEEIGEPSRDKWHKAVAAASGAVGGVFGVAALVVELPFSTTILLRSIADIARSEGEDLADPEVGMACLEVFALGGEPNAETGLEGGYLAARALLAQEVSASARFVLSVGANAQTAPVIAKLIPPIAARFGIAVSEKAVAQGAPILGAVGGAAINTAFADHFQSLARGHFIVRRLERRYGADLVREQYRRAQEGRPGARQRRAASDEQSDERAWAQA